MMSKALVSSTFLVAVLALGASHTAQAGPPLTRTPDPVATLTAVQPELAGAKTSVVPIPNGYRVIAEKDCGASKPEMSFFGEVLFAAAGNLVVASSIEVEGDCVCYRGDKCCCSGDWTCCNYDGRCCCSKIITEYQD